MAKSLILLGVALCAGVIVYLFLHSSAPAPSPPRSAASSSADSPQLDGGGNDAEAHLPTAHARDTGGPIAAPVSREQREHELLEARRGPLYAAIRQAAGAALTEVRPAEEDGATLELFASAESGVNMTALVDTAIQANAADYGFRHLRIYLPNSPTSVEKYRLDSEAHVGPDGNWQTFRK